MYLLPSERTKQVAEAKARFKQEGRLTIWEPCNCGGQIRHNNGENYHQVIDLAADSGGFFIRISSTCELASAPEWTECDAL